MSTLLKKLPALIAAALLVGSLTGCDDTFDASSKAALEESLDKITAELDIDEKRELRHALSDIGSYYMNKHRRDGLAGFNEAELEVQDAIDGKTAKQVIALAEKLRKDG